MKKNIVEKLDFQDFSIGKKFAVSLIVFLILPLALLLLWMNYSLINHINEQNLKTNLEILKQTKTPIDYMIQDLSYVSVQVIGDENLQKYLKQAGDRDKKLMEEIRYNISKLLETKGYITRLSVYDQDSIHIQQGAYLREEDTSYMEKAAKRKGKPYWLPGALETEYVSAWDRVYEVAMIRAIYDNHSFKDILSYVRVNVDEGYICSLYRGIRDEGTEGIFIADGLGNVVSSVNKELLGTNILNQAYFETMKRQSEGWMKLKRNQYISFYHIPEIDWYVIKINTADSLLGGKLLNSMGIICLALIVLFGVIFYFIQKRHIITPVKLLSADVSKFHEGAYDIRQYIESKDEIGVLNHSFIEMGKYIEELIERVYKSQIKEKEAQLSYLQSQINPHFLYNTLDSIRWMAIKQKQYEMAEQIEALANLFKHALNQGKEMTTVHNEVLHLKDYLLIQKNKFGDRLQTEISMDEEVEHYPVLNLILQPLVENAIVHGFKDKLGTGYIKVTIRKDNKNLIYEISDNGLGTDESIVREILESGKDSHNALALDNINKRLKYKYGEDYGILFTSKIGMGTSVSVRIPYEEGKNDEIIDCG